MSYQYQQSPSGESQPQQQQNQQQQQQNQQQASPAHDSPAGDSPAPGFNHQQQQAQGQQAQQQNAAGASDSQNGSENMGEKTTLWYVSAIALYARALSMHLLTSAIGWVNSSHGSTKASCDRSGSTSASRSMSR